MTDNTIGRDHLEDLSRLKIRLGALAPIESVIVIRATASKATPLSSVLRLTLGRSLHVHIVNAINKLDQALSTHQPHLIIIDDQDGKKPSAEVCLAVLGTSGFERGVIVATNQLSHARHLALIRLGAADVIDIDDINVRRLTEAILRACEKPEKGE